MTLALLVDVCHQWQSLCMNERALQQSSLGRAVSGTHNAGASLHLRYAGDHSLTIRQSVWRFQQA
jgi:hypothetical protein